MSWTVWRRVRQAVQIASLALYVYLLFAALQRRAAFPLADLFFRLNVVPLRLPPLRERTDDIPDLVAYFLRQNEKHGLPLKIFSAGAIEALKRARWPGNIRELENFVSRL